LGKVSRSQLSKYYLEGRFDDLQATLGAQDAFLLDSSELSADGLVNPVEFVVAEVISVVFSVDASSLRRSQSVFDIGASSMHLLRLKRAIQDRLLLQNFPTIEMLKRPQIGELCDYLVEIVAADKNPEGMK